jgi:3-phosphoglycerate kinase
VPLADDIVGVHALEAAARLQNGEFLMLENVRFRPGEEANDPAFAAELAHLGELFVQDAFGTLHRAHASTVGVAKRLPTYAGFLVDREVRELSRLVDAPEHPYVALLGGAKVADKLPLLTSLTGRADAILIGGALAFPFLQAQGVDLGSTPVESGLEDDIARFLAAAKAAGTMVQFPEDLLYEVEGLRDAQHAEVGAAAPKGVARDIGPRTRDKFYLTIAESKTVFWNGPLGLAEDLRFSAGTREVLAGLATVPGYQVAAGGDSARIANDLGVTNAFQYVSTGGGAALEFVQGAELPGLAVITDA